MIECSANAANSMRERRQQEYRRASLHALRASTPKVHASVVLGLHMATAIAVVNLFDLHIGARHTVKLVVAVDAVHPLPL